MISRRLDVRVWNSAVAEIFDTLPGIEVPVGEITKRLADMWTDSAANGKPAPATDDAKATQVNFVLHLGLNTSPEDAERQFQTVVRFSRRYPSRIVVLCPQNEEAGRGTEMRAKIYGECHLGKSKTDKRCVEFVMLSYPRAARRFLESQVSICLSTDLPLYYWAHRFSATARLADYQYLLGRAKRVLIDSAIAPTGALTDTWPRPDALRDLAYARVLPIRQTVGQFLSGYAPTTLVEGLQAVTVTRGAALTAEAAVLQRWVQERLQACGASTAVTYAVVPAEGDAPTLAIEFRYPDARRFRWTADLSRNQATFDANLGAGHTTLAAAASVLPPENALSEAMFF